MTKTTRIHNRYEYTPDTQRDLLGQGGMGIVYRGVDTTTQTPVAIKLLKSEFIARDPHMIERFQREGEALRTLNHPNIVKILDAVEEDETHYLIMEYVQGGSLYDVLAREGQLAIERILYIALDLADALTRAHRLNILHRDIKPANVLIAQDGTPRLTDFGMARIRDAHEQLTRDGDIVGTLAYLAPEIYEGETADERADIWAFGIMLYEMLTGSRPFTSDQPATLINAIVTQPIPDVESVRPDAPTALIDLVYRMLNKDRRARIPSVRLVGAELENIIRGKDNRMQAVVVADDGRFDTPTPSPVMTDTNSPRTPNNLPAQPTPFIGRQREISDLSRLIAQGERLITLIGTGGVGKSRTALEVAQEHLSRFPDGVYHVPLAPLDNPDLVLTALADNIRFDFAGGDRLMELSQYLREKTMLLIVDNFEHVMASAENLGELISHAPNLVIMVTSRERLRLRGEQIYEVDGMVVPPQQSDDLDTLLGYPSMQLFVQSARRVRGDFRLDDVATAQHVADIVREVQGLPLGIELAASWLEMLPLEDISKEIQRSLDFLETDLRDVPERHRSIRAVFEYSWNLMNESERETFLRLSIFRGGFEREAAMSVADASLRALTSLVNKSLLRRDPHGRYHAHKLLRQYAEERWQSDGTSREKTGEKHAQYYAMWLTQLYPNFTTGKEKQTIEAIEKEFDNIMTALDWALDCCAWDAIEQTILPMSYYFLSRSLLQDGHAIVARIVNRMVAKGATDHRAIWIARTHLALLGGRMGSYQQSLDIAQEAYAVLMQMGDKIQATYALNAMSYSAMMLGQFEEAYRYASDATELMQNLEDKNAWFVAMGNLAYAEYLRGYYDQANVLYETWNYMAEQHGASPIGRAYNLNNQGELLADMGQLERARALFEQAHNIFKEYGHLRGLGFTLNNLAGIHFFQADYAQAKSFYQRSYDLNQKIGDLMGLAHSISNLGNVAMTEANNDEAIQCYEKALALRRQMGDRRGIADSLLDLAHVFITTGRLQKAQDYADESIQIRREIGDRIGLGGGLLGKAMAMLLMEDKIEQVRPMVEEGTQIAEEVGNVFMLVQSHIGRGELALHDGDIEGAEHHFVQVLKTYHASQAIGLSLYGLIGLARIHQVRGELEQALANVTIVLRNRRTFGLMIEEFATRILEELTTQLPEDVVMATMERTQSMTFDSALKAILKAHQ